MPPFLTLPCVNPRRLNRKKNRWINSGGTDELTTIQRERASKVKRKIWKTECQLEKLYRVGSTWFFTYSPFFPCRLLLVSSLYRGGKKNEAEGTDGRSQEGQDRYQTALSTTNASISTLFRSGSGSSFLLPTSRGSNISPTISLSLSLSLAVVWKDVCSSLATAVGFQKNSLENWENIVH